MSKLWVCIRCGYHYPKEKMVTESRKRVDDHGNVVETVFKRYCSNRTACDRHVALREKDRKAVKGK